MLYLKRLVGLVVLLCIHQTARAQCSCSDCPVFAPSNQTVSSLLDISGSTNDVLGVNGQGILAICITFVHDAIDEIDMTLIAPDGSSVLLIDNTGVSINDNISYDICFVACTEDADPDPGFSEAFDSDEDWLAGGSYGGSYYPAQGNLEDLTGSINGTWMLEITDFVGGDDGTVFDWCLQLSDDAGLGCGSTCYQPQCGAIAGELPAQDGVFCTGEDDLAFNIDPIECNGADPGLFGYTFIVVDDDNGELLQFTDDPDLTSYDPGIYTICGLSYLLADEGLLPNPPLGAPLSQLEGLIDDGTICGDLSSSCISVTILDPPPVPDFSSDTVICVGSMETFTLANYNPAFTWDFTWELVGGGGSLTVFDTEDEVTLTFPATGEMQVCWLATNDCGTQDSCYIIQVVDAPELLIGGPDEACPGATLEYIAAAIPELGGAAYQFTVSGGTVTIQNDSAITVQWDANPGTGEICVELVDFSCNVQETCIEVDLEEYMPPATIDLPGSICSESSGIAALLDDPLISSVTWTGTGVNIVSGQGTNEIEFEAVLPGVGEVCAEITSDCGGVFTICESIDIYEFPEPEITGVSPDPSCGDPFTIFMSSGAGTIIDWVLLDGPPGGAAIDDPGSASPTVITSGAGTYVFVVSESIDDCIGYDTITIEVAGTPEIVNVNTECDVNGDYTVSFEIQDGLPPYLVNDIEISGTIFFSGPIPAGEMYSFTVTDQNDCFVQIEGDGDCPCVEPLVIVDIEEECIGQDEFILTFDVVSDNPPFTTNINGLFSGNSFESDQLSTSVATNVIVTDANGCTAEFSVGPVNCGCESEAGMMSPELIQLCEGDSIIDVVYLGGETLDQDDIQRFVIHTSAGSIIGTVLLETSGQQIVLPTMLLQTGTLYYVSHVVGNAVGGNLDFNDPCLDVSQGQPFIINPVPQFTIPDSAETCPGSIGITISNAGDMGQLSVFSNSGGGPVNLDLVGNTITVGSSTATVVGVEYWEANGTCEKRDTVIVTFYEGPEVSSIVETCNVDSFVVSFLISGGLEPYIVNGTTINGDQFVSGAFISGEMAQFVVRDERGCVTIFSTTIDCSCLTDAGTLSGQVAQACLGESIDLSGLVLTGGQLEPDDTTYFVVHDGTANSLGTIIDTPQAGIIEYKPQFVPGEIYFVSAIAGNLLSGGVDPSDPCFNASNGLEVTWLEMNQAVLPDTVSGCENTVVSVSVESVGLFPFVLYLSSDNGRTETIDINNGSSTFDLLVMPGVEFWMIDSISGDCADIGQGQLVVIGDPAPEPAFGTVPDVCNNATFGSVLDLGNLVINNTPGTWSSQEFIVTDDKIDFDGVAAGTYIIEFTTEPVVCPSEVYQVNVEIIDCECPDISIPSVLDLCETASSYDLESSFNIFVSGTWIVGNPDNLARPPVVQDGTLDVSGSSAGSYILEFSITDSLPDNCIDLYSMVLNVVQVPEAMITIIDVSCFGANDGILSVDPVDSGAGPYIVTIDDVLQDELLNAAPGMYQVVIEDSLGCRFSELVSIDEPDPLELSLSAPDSILEGTEVRVIGSVNSSSVSGISWHFDGTFLDSSGLELLYVPLETDTVILEILSGSGCFDTAEVIIVVVTDRDTVVGEADVFIPNVFNPTSRNPLNRIFTVYSGTEDIDITYFRVFDRWGALVFELDKVPAGSPVTGWDGTYQGKVVNPGVFVYAIAYTITNGEEVVRIGDVTVIR